MVKFTSVRELKEIPQVDGWKDVEKFKSRNRIVNADGNDAIGASNGVRYQIVSKKEREISIFERIGRISLGVFYTAITCGFALSIKSVRKLFTKQSETIRFGIEVLPETHHTETEKDIDACDQSPYTQLRSLLRSENSTIGINSLPSEKPIALTRILGSGGSKTAVELEDGSALLLPNTDVDHPKDIARRWARIVEEEVAMSDFLASIGLLSTSAEKVDVFLSSDPDMSLPAYKMDSFNTLAQKEMWIIDSKNLESSSWTKEMKLFSKDTDIAEEAKWDEILDLLCQDIAKIVYYDVPALGDSCNLAIVKDKGHYKPRFFGFDFSSKHYPIKIPTREASNISSDQMRHKAERVISSMLETLYLAEIKAIALPAAGKCLINRLKERYAETIMTEIKNLEK